MNGRFVVVWVDNVTKVPFGADIFENENRCYDHMLMFWHAGTDIIFEQGDKMFGRLYKCDDQKSCYIFPG